MRKSQKKSQLKQRLFRNYFSKSQRAPLLIGPKMELVVALIALRQALSEAVILGYPRFDHDFVLEVNASLKGLGACLSQPDESGTLHPVAFASRCLTITEKASPICQGFN